MKKRASRIVPSSTRWRTSSLTLLTVAGTKISLSRVASDGKRHFSTECRKLARRHGKRRRASKIANVSKRWQGTGYCDSRHGGRTSNAQRGRSQCASATASKSYPRSDETFLEAALQKKLDGSYCMELLDTHGQHAQVCQVEGAAIHRHDTVS